MPHANQERCRSPTVRICNRLAFHIAAITILITVAPPDGMAGGQNGQPIPHSADRVAALARKVERSLAQRGARVAIVARLGRPRDSLPPDVRFTHVALAVYSDLTLDDGRQVRGYTFHNLYETPENARRSGYVQDYPFDFFANAVELKAGILVLHPKLQRAIIRLVASGYLHGLHRTDYSVISNPHNARYQNCTEFVLDAIHASLYETTEVAELKSISEQFFEPQPVKLGAMRSLFASLVVPEVRFDDHDGQAATATFSTIARYLQTHVLSRVSYEVTL